MSADGQCYGFGFIETGSGSIILSESGAGYGFEYGSRVLMTKIEEKNTAKTFFLNFFLIKNCNLIIPRPPQRTSSKQEKPSALKREHPALQKMKFINRFQFFLAIFALLDPEPDRDSGPWTPLNPDPIQIRIGIHNTANGKIRYWFPGQENHFIFSGKGLRTLKN
jgi:hypothetical protein